MKICFVLGTRPEIIKMAPIIKECEKNSIDYFILHTGQHNLVSLIKDLRLPEPEIVLDLPPESAGKFKGSLFAGIFNATKWSLLTASKIRRVLKKKKPDVVLYEGDTLAIASAAFAAKTIWKGPTTGHVEAGLRTRDMFNPFPEEFARWFADKFSDLMFAPTKKSIKNIKEERFIHGKVFLTGNTVVDASLQHLPLAEKIHVDLPKKYCIVFIHRQENIHSKSNLQRLLKTLSSINEEILFIKHPTIMQKIKEFGLMKEFESLPNMHFKDFYDYLSYLKVLNNAEYVITDSGGLQEEACTLRFPCIVWRKKTERPEAVEAGAAVLVGSDVEKTLKIISEIKSKTGLYKSVKAAKNPFGDGHAAEKIIKILQESIK